MIESATACAPENLASLPGVPPAVVTPLPAPAQLPAVVHTSLVPIFAPVALTLKNFVEPPLLVTSKRSVPNGEALSAITSPPAPGEELSVICGALRLEL